jgi:hypothetical protein
MKRFVAFFALAGALALGAAAPAATVPYGPHVLYAIVKQIHPNALVVQTHTGALVRVDIKTAAAAKRTGVLYVGRAVALHGDYDAQHAYHVNAITSATGILYGGPWPHDE